MVICKEDGSSYEEGGDGAIFICECSMGDPFNEFGLWFQERFCGAPSMFEQLAGVKEHRFTEVRSADVTAVRCALKDMTHTVDVNKFIDYMYDHIGKHISTENW
jgi:hypothetical protein